MQRLRLADAEPAQVVDRVEGMIALKGLEEATWWLGELSTPEGLADELVALGLEPDDPPEMTSLTIGTAPAGEPAVEVRRVETIADALVASELDWECFGVAEEERALRRDEVAAAWPALQAGGLQTTYLAYLEGEAGRLRPRRLHSSRRLAPRRRDSALGTRPRRLHLARSRPLGGSSRARDPTARRQRRPAVRADPRKPRLRTDRPREAPPPADCLMGGAGLLRFYRSLAFGTPRR